MRIVLVALLICSGCVFCESPYIKTGDSCCLDEDDNGFCDAEPSIEPEPNTTHQVLYRTVTNELQVQATKLQPFELDFYVSTQQHAVLESVEFNATPMCSEDHEVLLWVNGRDYSTSALKCSEPFGISIQRSDIDVGKNTIGIISTHAPFLMDNVIISINQQDTDTIQDLGQWLLEAPRSNIILAADKEILLQNYYDLEFEAGDEAYADIIFFVQPEGNWNYDIYLNNVYLRSAHGVQNITLPKDRIASGKNVLRYVLK